MRVCLTLAIVGPQGFKLILARLKLANLAGELYIDTCMFN